MTERLYEIDSHISEFDAQIISVTKTEDGYITVLDRTAFFPEGGGQASDTGAINGVSVDYVFMDNNVIYHCTKEPLEKGKAKCILDFDRRFAFMQNHSGEHIVSGIVNEKYGFDNVGFHLGEDFVTLDFNGVLSRAQLDEIEYEANKRVWQNVKFKAWYPSKEELQKLPYRSKKEIDGDIRIVQIENTDMCACCAPHVKEAGEIGIIKLLDFEALRGGIRIFMKCGEFALKDYRNKYENALKISATLAAKQNSIADVVLQLEKKYEDEKHKVSALNKRITDNIVKGFNTELDGVIEENFEIKELQMLADGLHKTYGGIKSAFSKCDGGYNFAICGDVESLDEFFKYLKTKLNIRGGGRNGMVQGCVFADMSEISKYFKF
ncbi:MAG: alanyl-tRNA editing protein [Clostridia bacterium]|nr:alanyl-tRNA editing protein [Clostridia bacterium]